MSVKQKYIIKDSDFRFHKKTYPEGSVIELTEEQFQDEGKRIKLVPVDTDKVPMEILETSQADEKTGKKPEKKK